MNKSLDPKLLRILEGLKAAGVQHGSRNRTVAEKTGYSENTVLKALSGNTQSLSPRFSRAVCEAFGISGEWVEEGKEPVLTGEIPKLHTLLMNDAISKLPQHHGGLLSPDVDRVMDQCFVYTVELKRAGHSAGVNSFYAEISEKAWCEWTDDFRDISEHSGSIAITEAIKILKKMSKAMQWRAVGILEELLEAGTKKPDTL